MKKLFLVFLVASFGAVTGLGQSAYFQAVTNLNPVGYWPMHEATPPAPGDIETNLGTLGDLGDGFYSRWNTSVAVSYTNQVPGALANDPDTAVAFKGNATGFVLIPHTVPLTSLLPPFTIECWAKPFGTGGGSTGDILGNGGTAFGSTSGNGFVGIRFYLDSTVRFRVYIGTGTAQPSIVSGSFAQNQWHHEVLTCDANTNFTLYVDGTVIGSSSQPGYVPSTWNPFCIGGSLWTSSGPSRYFPGAVDEVAIYTNDLSSTDIGTHYTYGTSGSADQYRTNVLASNPAIYLRMNAPDYGAPDTSTWPALMNYGSVGVNGVYSPGTMPGIVSGPANPAGVPFGGLSVASGTNVAQFSGVSSFADAGYAAEYNPTGAVPFSLAAIARGNPTDGRRQTIVGHGDNSWRLWFGTGGQFLWQVGTNASAVTSQVHNDGNWHHVVAVYTPASNPSDTGTNAIYVDGVLEAISSSVTPNGILPGTNLNVMIGADPQYTNNPAVIGRQLAGQVCEVAVFTNSLTAGQIQALYAAAGVAPSIKTQPVSASANQNSAFTNTVVATGSAPLSYQWYQDGLPRSGQTSASLILTPVQPSDQSTNWYVVVTNGYGAVTSSVVSLTVFSVPTITSQSSTDVVLFAGGNVTFTLAASGALPLSYQWISNSVPISDATNTSYTLTNVQLGSSPSFYCVVTNVAGSTNTAPVTLMVITAPAAPYPQAVLAASPLGYWRLNEADNGLGNGNAGVVAHDYWGGNNGIYTNTYLGQSGYNSATDPTTTSAQFGYYATSDSGALGIAGVDFSSPTNTSRAFSVAAWVNGGSSQISGAGLVTKGYGNGGEQFNLDVSGSGTTRGFRFFVRDAAGATHGYTSTVNLDGTWHHVVGVCDQPNGAVSLYIDGVLAGQGSITPGSGILASTHVMSIGSRRSSATTNYNYVFVGNMNDVAVYGYALSAGQVLSNFLVAGVAPRITQQPPVTATVAEGGTLTVSAAVLGTLPLSYQWSDSFSSPLMADQTNATLTISNVPAGLNGDSLTLTVTNLYGSASANAVTLTVISGPPQILASNLWARVTLPLGKSYTYFVEASGTLPFSYQWYNGGSPAVGATNASYTVTGSALGSSTISVVVTNVNGSAGGSSLLTVIAPPSDPYATAVQAFQPVGYWPLRETYAPAPATVETNYGTLGAIGNAYYASANVTFAQGGALTDGDTSVATTGANTSYAFVPRKSTNLTLQAPITLECWMAPTGGGGTADLISEGGSGLNSAANSGNFGGVRMSFGGGSGDGDTLQFFAYIGSGGIYNGGNTNIQTPAATITRTVWNHCVATYDGTNVLLYVNGQLRGSGTTPMAIDTWTPLTIGGGRWQGQAPTRRFTGGLDEVAVYTNVLSPDRVLAHYNAGTTVTPSNYVAAVQADRPLLYYRMDTPGYVTPDPATYPAAVNFGSAPVNGAYAGGVVPGGVSGPSILGLGTSLAAPINGIISCVDGGNDPAFNPAGTQPLSGLVWFKGYPGDGRVQGLFSHGTNWQMYLDGTTGKLVCNLNKAGSLTSTTILNDGDWHMAASVFDGANGYLYVDGVLNVSAAAAGVVAGDANANVFLGGNSDFTTVGTDQEYFAGALAQAAFFTNALTAAQIKGLYDLATVPTISLAGAGNNLTITYTGTLRSSTNMIGPYEPIAGASSPYPVPQTDARRFYRTSNP